MGATRNTGYIENLIAYDGNNNIGVGGPVNVLYKVTIGGNTLISGNLNVTGTITFSSNVTANSFVKNGGVATEFLKADGTVDSSTYATVSYVDTSISNLIDAAPAALNTLNELAAALGDDSSFSTTVTTALGNRLRIDTDAQGLTSEQKANGRTNLGVVIGTDVQAYDADLGAIAALSGTSGFLKKTAANTWSLDTTAVTGTGTLNYLPKFTVTGSAIGNSLVYDNGSTVFIGTTTTSTQYTSEEFVVTGGSYTNVEFRGTSQAALALTKGTNSTASSPAVEIFNSGNFGIVAYRPTVVSSNYIIYYALESTSNRSLAFQTEGSDRLTLNQAGTVRLNNYTTNGFVKFSGGDGTLSVDTTSYLPLTGGTLTGTLQVSPAAGVAWYYANRINTSTEAGIQLRTNGTAEWYTGLRNAANQTDNYHFYSYTTNSSVARITPAGQFIFASTLGNGTYTYTLPSATGTLALTSDIPSTAGLVTLATSQTITGAKVIQANFLGRMVSTTTPADSAYAAKSYTPFAICDNDSHFEMFGVDDDTTWRHAITFKNINPTTGNLVSGFGLCTHMNTGNPGNNTFDRFALSWGTNTYPQGNDDIMSWKPSGKVGIGEINPGLALVIKRNEADGLLRLHNTSATGYSNIQFYNNSGVFKGSFGYINTGTAGSISGKFLWDMSSADAMIRGGNVIVGDESTAQGKLYVVDGSVTTKTTSSNNGANYWYSISDAYNIVRVRDTTEISINKTTGAGYGNMVVYSEVVESNFTMDFKLVLGNPGSSYRHFAIGIPTNNTDNVNQYDFIVFRHNVSDTNLNQIRVDQAGATTLDSVGSFNPNWADGAERHVRITINNNIIFIEVNGSEVFRGTMNPRTNLRGRIGFAVYESSTSANTWAIIRNFNLQQFGNDRTSLPLNVSRSYSSLSPASITVGSYNYSLAYGWHVRDGVIGSRTQVRSNGGVTAMGRNYADFPANPGLGGAAEIIIPNRKAFRKVYGYIRVRGGASTDGWTGANGGPSSPISAERFMDGIAITGVDTANANETWIWGIVCNNYDAAENAGNKPSFVGNNYQTFLTNHATINGLWLTSNDGQGRTPVKTFYFERTLSSDIVGNIRIRIMSDQSPVDNEDVGIEEFAIYVAPETDSNYHNAATYRFLGDVVATGDVTAYGSASDIRLKEIKEKVPNALQVVNKLNGYRFDWKEKPGGELDIKEDIGVVAQEVVEVLPELARINENGFMSVRYQGLTAVLIEAIKEQQQQIEELKSQIKNK